MTLIRLPLLFSQVILSMQLPFAVIPLVRFVSDGKKIGPFVIPAWVAARHGLSRGSSSCSTSNSCILAKLAGCVWPPFDSDRFGFERGSTLFLARLLVCSTVD
jgi:hypothetical protein